MAAFRAPLPSCPHCNGAMRASPYADGALCRCGFTVDHEALVATRATVDPTGRAAVLRQAGRFTPIPQAEPGIRVGSFADLNKVSWWRRSEGPLPGTAESVDASARTSAKFHGLDVQSQGAFGVYLVVQRPGGQRENLERHAMYGLAPWGRLDECANEMVMAIAAKHGPGRLWGLSSIVHLISDDDPGAAVVSDVGGVPHVWLRSVYFHDPVRGDTDAFSSSPDWNPTIPDGAAAWSTKDTGVTISSAHAAQSLASVMSFKITGPAQAVADVASQVKSAGRPGHPPRQVWPRSFRTLPDGRVETEWSDVEVAREDVTYGGVPLRMLLDIDQKRRQESGNAKHVTFTTLQRDAVSAYHSDQLRAKVKASAAADKARETSVVVDLEDL